MEVIDHEKLVDSWREIYDSYNEKTLIEHLYNSKIHISRKGVVAFVYNGQYIFMYYNKKIHYHGSYFKNTSVYAFFMRDKLKDNIDLRIRELIQYVLKKVIHFSISKDMIREARYLDGIVFDNNQMLLI